MGVEYKTRGDENESRARALGEMRDPYREYQEKRSRDD